MVNSRIRHEEPPLVIGADLGGTWLRVAVARGGRRLGTVTERAPDLGALRKSLLTIWKRRRLRPAQIAALVVAARSIWTPGERRALARRLSGLAGRVAVLSDAQAALLGALGGSPGLLFLAGTGSIVIGRDERGRWGRAGGFGPLLGDEGSAFWLGREWLRRTTRGEDFLPARALVRAPDAAARIAALAPAVVGRARRGHPIARAIVREGQEHLARFGREVADGLRLRAPVRASWAGSVLEDRWFRAGLQRAVRRAGLRVVWRSPVESPATAALSVALDLAGGARHTR